MPSARNPDPPEPPHATPVRVSRLRWTPLDASLLAGSLVSIVALVVVRWAIAAPLLAHAIRPFEYSDAPLPFVTRPRL